MALNQESGHFSTMCDDEKPSKPRPARGGPTPASENPGLRGQKRRPDGPRQGRGRKRGRDRGRSDRASAPTPVREAMDEPALEPTPLPDFPGRTFVTESGEEWSVRRTGLAQIGHGRGSPGVMMHLSFSRADDPEKVLGEALTPSTALDSLTEAELARLLATATAEGRETGSPADGGSDTRRGTDSQP